MSRSWNVQIAQQFLASIGELTPAETSELFSPDVQFEIAGDVGALPWIGRKVGRGAVSDFIAGTRRLITQLRFDVQDILASDDRAVIVGELATMVNATGKAINSTFVIVFTVRNGEIVRFQMLEDSFAVSQAAR